jgi:hypothetical protein
MPGGGLHEDERIDEIPYMVVKKDGGANDSIVKSSGWV